MFFILFLYTGIVLIRIFINANRITAGFGDFLGLFRKTECYTVQENIAARIRCIAKTMGSADREMHSEPVCKMRADGAVSSFPTAPARPYDTRFEHHKLQTAGADKGGFHKRRLSQITHLRRRQLSGKRDVGHTVFGEKLQRLRVIYV